MILTIFLLCGTIFRVFKGGYYMLRGMDDCSDTFMNEVCDYFEITHRMDLLRKRYPDIDYSLLCSILYSSYRFKNEVYSCLSQERINEKKMLIISDTHYGSIYQNMRYTYDVFDYALLLLEFRLLLNIQILLIYQILFFLQNHIILQIVL